MDATDATEIHAFLEALDRVGFTIVPALIDPMDVSALRKALQRAIARHDLPGGRDHGMVHALVLHGEPFERLLYNPRLRSLTSAALGSTSILYAYTSSSMPPRGANYSARIHVDCPRLVPGYMTNLGVTLMLDDFTEDNGATWLLPCSHRRADPPGEEEFFAGAVRGLGQAGDAIVFNARTWHSGGENRTGAWRHAVTMNVCRSYMRQQFDWVRLVPDEIVERNPPEFQQFLGYDVRMPTSLDEFYLPEAKRLYKAGQG